MPVETENGGPAHIRSNDTLHLISLFIAAQTVVGLSPATAFGPVKPMNAGNNGPLDRTIESYTALRIPFARLRWVSSRPGLTALFSGHAIDLEVTLVGLQLFLYICSDRVGTDMAQKETDILFHGSNVIVEKPIIQISGYYKDFGYGFYCTRFEKQAIRWSLTKRGEHIVNSYSYSHDSNLSVLSFEKMTDQWLDFVVSCRRGIPHNYDIVEGPMADDQIWDYVEDYMAGSITREAFWELVKFKYPTHQIVFCTGKALETLRFTEYKHYDE